MLLFTLVSLRLLSVFLSTKLVICLFILIFFFNFSNPFAVVHYELNRSNFRGGFFLQFFWRCCCVCFPYLTNSFNRFFWVVAFWVIFFSSVANLWFCLSCRINTKKFRWNTKLIIQCFYLTYARYSRGSWHLSFSFFASFSLDFPIHFFAQFLILFDFLPLPFFFCWCSLLLVLNLSMSIQLYDLPW